MKQINPDVVELAGGYGCSICKEIYSWPDEAQDCFNKGLIGDGPEIKPGLLVDSRETVLESRFKRGSFNIFRGWEEYTGYEINDYLLFLGEGREGHHRVDDVYGIKSNLTLKGLLRGRIKTYDWNLNGRDIKRNELRRLIKSEQIRLLDEEEFERAKDIIKNELPRFREGVFKKEFEERLVQAINNPYRYHEYFDKNKK